MTNDLNRWKRTRQKWKDKNKPDENGYYICAICKQKVHISKLSLDHIISKSLYPELEFDITNLQPTHAFCNKEKGTGDPGTGTRMIHRYGKNRKRIW